MIAVVHGGDDEHDECYLLRIVLSLPYLVQPIQYFF